MSKLLNIINRLFKPAAGADQKIHNRESWVRMIAFSAFSIVLIYKIATAEFIFRFSDFLALFASIFAVILSVLVLNRLTRLTDAISGTPDKNEWNMGETVEPAETLEHALAETAAADETALARSPLSNEDLDAKIDKEQELEKIELDKTLLWGELFTRAQLTEEEKRLFLEKIGQKEKEAYTVQEELSQFRTKWQQAFTKGTNLFKKPESQLDKMAELLGTEAIMNGSFIELNQRVKELRNQFSEETVRQLTKSEFVDEDFNLTRTGYKELLKAVKSTD